MFVEDAVEGNEKTPFSLVGREHVRGTAIGVALPAIGDVESSVGK